MMEIFFRWGMVLFFFLAGAFFINPLANRLVRYSRKIKNHDRYFLKQEQQLLMTLRAFFWIVILALSINMLQPALAQNLFLKITLALPQILLFFLLLFFGLLVIHLLIYGLRGLFFSFGFFDVFPEMKQQFIEWTLLAIRLVLYLILFFLLLDLYNVQLAFFSYLVLFFLIALIATFFGLLFIGFRPFMQDVFAGFLLRNKEEFSQGNLLRFFLTPDFGKAVEGEIKEVRALETVLRLKRNRTLALPNHLVYQAVKEYKQIKTAFESLQEILPHYVTQKRSHCGPAVLSMIFSFLGYHIHQDVIAREAKTVIGRGTHPQALIDVAKKLSHEKLLGAWISVDKIADLRKEIVSWLKDDAFVVVDFKKKFVFPEAKTAHYALCVSVVGDELLIVDPNKEMGGVYFVAVERIYRGMNTYSPLIGGKRGYLVFAYEGTRAYERIKEGLLYLEPTVYEKLTKPLREKLQQFEEQLQEPVKDLLPKPLKTYLKKEKVERVWKP